jgi:hypothetical protein
MRRHTTALLALTLAAAIPGGSLDAQQAMVGRWDITIRTPTGDLPSWLEIRRSGTSAIVGQMVGAVGSARPISTIEVRGDSIRFSIPRQWEQGGDDVSFEGRLEGGRLSGSMTWGDGKRHGWTAVRAPSLIRARAPEWGEPVQLFSGADLSGWRVVGGENQWRALGGVLRNERSGGNLVTERRFGDFKLHVEFRYPKGSNSGVYLRGRYEVQVEDSTDVEPANDLLGAVYGFLAPSELVAGKPDTWQTFDITLVGRRVTVVANGTTVICDREIPGITGGALDSDEGTPGPLMLQGDHGTVEYRNITLTPAR